MIKHLLILLVALYITDGRCGVSVVGTRFMITDKMQQLNIKLVNDNESDYLIKSTVDDKDFIISPPLFLLKKGMSNIITIIPKDKINHNRDKTVNLVITSIPKSTASDNVNSVSMAVRSHFKIIYRHRTIDQTAFDNLKLIREDNQCLLVNHSDFSFTVSVENEKKSARSRVINVIPGEKKILDFAGLDSSCAGWITFYNEFDDVINVARSPKEP